MKLRDLVALRNTLLESISLDNLRCETDQLLQKIVSLPNVTSHIDAIYLHKIDEVKTYYKKILDILDQPPTSLLDLKSNIEAEIASRSQTFDKRGYLINGFVATDAADVAFERNERGMLIHSDTMATITGRIDLYSDWRYPGLEIGPGDGSWTKLMVANDPLYIVDIYPEFLASAKSQFTPEFQARVRPYNANQFSETPYNMLPTGQFGFVFAWNVFTFYPHFEMSIYLSEVFKLLRPGGVFLFSYNNCDRPENAGYAEEGWMSWMPNSMLSKLVTDLGFETLGFYDAETNVSWAEIKKPGHKHTIKAHQVMGEIVSITS